MRIKRKDFIEYTTGQIEAKDLSLRYNLPLTTVYEELSYYKRTPKRLTSEERKQLRSELLNACPYDKQYGLKAILTRYGLKTITQALQMLKEKSLAELRGAPPELLKLLKDYKLHLTGNILHPKGRIKAILTQYEVNLNDLYARPGVWFQEHLDIVNQLCHTAPKVRKEKQLSTTYLRKRFKTMTITVNMLRGHYSSREIMAAVGTGRYIRQLRVLKNYDKWYEKLFTPEELEILL